MSTALLLGMMLAFEPVEENVMRRAPRAPAAPILSKALIIRMLWAGFLFLLLTFAAFHWALAQAVPLTEARTLAVNALVLAQMTYLFNCRSLTAAWWTLGWMSNRWFWLGLISMLALQLAFTYWPPMNHAFASTPIPAAYWLWIAVGALAVSLLVGVEKWLQQRYASAAKP